jgi:hypothetical protein
MQIKSGRSQIDIRSTDRDYSVLSKQIASPPMRIIAS